MPDESEDVVPLTAEINAFSNVSASVSAFRNAFEDVVTEDSASASAIPASVIKAAQALEASKRIGFRIEWEQIMERPEPGWFVRVFDDKDQELASESGTDPISALCNVAEYLIPPGTIK